MTELLRRRAYDVRAPGAGARPGVVLLGPTGAGKGTQATLLAAVLGVPLVSTGDILRRHVSDRTPLGRQAQIFMDVGDLVPDRVTNAMVRDRLVAADTAVGFILDGFPRTLAQAFELDQILELAGLPLNAVVHLQVEAEEVVRRLAGRGRTDDEPAIVRHRLAVHDTRSAALVELYRSRHVLADVDAVGAVQDVTRNIYRVLCAAGIGPRGTGPALRRPEPVPPSSAHPSASSRP